ncbi:Hypothetical protein A7982_09961 [Minicystis rosea]|nr:Hypothetical protein A7982_09961 [Minicystis rosea]
MCRDIVDFHAAIREGRREAWIAQFFSSQYPADMRDEEILHDMLVGHDCAIELDVAECERCGRLHVQQKPGENAYLSYVPDEPGYAGVLRSDKGG